MVCKSYIHAGIIITECYILLPVFLTSGVKSKVCAVHMS